jgi:phage FluMu gp28-like protein
VLGVVFTNEAKAEMAELLLQQFERGTIRIPRHELLRTHLAAVTIGYTKTGARRYGADHGPDGHADLFWALALAVWSAVVRPPGAFDLAALAGTATAARGATPRPPRFIPRRRG